MEANLGYYKGIFIFINTFAEEAVLKRDIIHLSVCLSVYLSDNKITQKTIGWFWQNEKWR